MSHLQFTDELVREYLIFRGFSTSLKSFDNDLKIDKDKGFRVDKVVDQIVQFVNNYDLTGLREFWNHLDSRLFSRLEHNFAPSIKKLENGVLKFYLVFASENNKQDKIMEFFTKMTSTLVGHSEWKDWFVLPFIKNPEENPTFAVYFTKQWQDTLLVSLHNLLAAVYQCMPLPTLANFEESATRMSNLQKENDMLKKGLANLVSSEDGLKLGDNIQGLDIIMDDFCNISQEIKVSESQTKTLKTIMRNMSGTTPTSPKITPKSSLSTSGVSALSQGSQEYRKHASKKLPAAKRSVSIDARSSSGIRQRERDSSLDTTSTRGTRRDGVEKTQESGLLFLSQDEFGDHAHEISVVKFNSRGNMVASADTEGNLKVWMVAPMCKTLYSFTAKAALPCLSWVPNHERYIVAGTINGFICLYDTKEQRLMWEFEADATGSRIDDIVCTPLESNILVVCAGKLSVFDLKNKRIEKIVATKGRHVSSCCVSHNGSTLLVGCRDGTLQVIDLRKNEVMDVYELGTADLVQVKFTTDFTGCYALSDDSKLWYKAITPVKDKVQVIDIPAGVSKPRGKLFCLDVSGHLLLLAVSNSGVVYKVQGDIITKSLELGGHKAPLTCVDWSFANQCGTCITASEDGKIRISTILIDVP